MKILVDTNVVLDVLFDRKLHSTSSSKILALIETGKVVGILCATTITTIHYLSTKTVGRKATLEHIDNILSLFEIAPVNRKVLKSALHSRFSDFEDAVLHESGKISGVQGIITRDQKGFRNSDLPVYSPDEFLEGIKVL